MSSSQIDKHTYVVEVAALSLEINLNAPEEEILEAMRLMAHVPGCAWHVTRLQKYLRENKT